jgi:hypothetical protein
MAAGDVITIRENAGGRKANLYDGTDDYMLADAHAVARVAANDTIGTYSAWIYADAVAGTQTILSAGDANVAEYFQLQLIAGYLQIRLVVATVLQFAISQDTANIEDKTWTHVAVVQNGVQPVLYVNGLAVASTNDTATDITAWYDELTGVDVFAIGVRNQNATQTQDFKGAIGQVKYWNVALDETQILAEYNATSDGTGFGTYGTPALNITMENDGTTDSGSGADNGTLTGDAHYGGEVSAHSRAVEANVTGHAAETITTFPQGSKYVSIIKRGD